jgi:hypothetical protein
VVNVSWNDAVAFCEWLSEKEGQRYRLPTEAEWEFACRAGTVTPFHFGSQLNGREANCDGNYPYGTTTKGTYLKRRQRSGFLLRERLRFVRHARERVGVVCSDWYDGGYYANSPVDDPTGPTSGSVPRGPRRQLGRLRGVLPVGDPLRGQGTSTSGSAAGPAGSPGQLSSAASARVPPGLVRFGGSVVSEKRGHV